MDIKARSKSAKKVQEKSKAKQRSKSVKKDLFKGMRVAFLDMKNEKLIAKFREQGGKVLNLDKSIIQR